MNDNCITRFEVSNFKKFDHLIVENLGQVNLITGDNNVGKSTLLEALLCNEDNLRWIDYLHQTLCIRGIHFHLSHKLSKNPEFPNENYLKYIIKNVDKMLTCKYILASGEKHDLGIKYFELNDINDSHLSYRQDKFNIANVNDWVGFYKNGMLNELQWLHYDDMVVSKLPKFWPYIPLKEYLQFNSPSLVGVESIKEYTGSNNVERIEDGILDYTDKQKIIRYLSILMEDIVDYQTKKIGRDPVITIARKEDTIYRSITTFGDGFQKFFKYVFEIFYAQKVGHPRIMIDEIDTGVHYLRMKDQWKAIFELSKQTGIQIFATTHNMDSINSFVEAGEEVNDIKNDLRLVEVEEFIGKDGTTKHIATTYNHEILKHKLETETNIRGGDVWR